MQVPNANTEEESLKALDESKSKIETLLAQMPNDPAKIERNKVVSQLQSIIDQLEKVQPGTTSYSEAKSLLESAKQKLAQFSK